MSALDELEAWIEALNKVTPCTCSAQRTRAEKAEAQVDRVRELADEWERDARAEGFHYTLPLGKVTDLRRALDGGAP